MRTLPRVRSLTEAVQTVIRENKRDGYNPTYFTRMVLNATDLRSVCSNLVVSQNALSALVTAFETHPDLLTIEDFIAHFGHAWGFSPGVIESDRKGQRASHCV